MRDILSDRRRASSRLSPFVTRDILRSELERSEARLIKWMFGIVLGSLGASAALVTAVTAVVSLLG